MLTKNAYTNANLSSGKWYWEITITQTGWTTPPLLFGIGDVRNSIDLSVGSVFTNPNP